MQHNWPIAPFGYLQLGSKHLLLPLSIGRMGKIESDFSNDFGLVGDVDWSAVFGIPGVSPLALRFGVAMGWMVRMYVDITAHNSTNVRKNNKF